MRPRRYRLAVAGLAVTAAVVVYGLATQVFPYHTSNHDEAVYLQQAAMLLEGKLFLRPPVVDAFRPWFFVETGDGRLYPKYSPVPAGIFAVGKLLGGYRIALALVAAGVVGLTVRVGRELFDRRTGLLAGVLLLSSPLFLVDASVFLPYVPTTLFNLGFAAAYLHADRTGSKLAAALAGASIGIAFFARPYTAVLFAAPFVAHALWTLRGLDRGALVRQGLTAALGLAGVAVTLGYNAVVTGDPLLFPYQAFAPMDGPGFGTREILGYSRDYTPALALRSNAEALWVLATRWVVAGAVGTLAAAVGLAVVLRRGIGARRAALAGVFLSVPLGNVFFWGVLNTLGDLDRAGDGLIHYLGTYYHVDLLVPTAVFGAVGLTGAGARLRDAVERQSWATPRHGLAAIVICGTVLTALSVGMVAGPVADNHAVTERYEQAYDPFEDRPLDDGLVFLPTPYGDWLGHPFQTLRNDPGYDDGTVYALADEQFAVVDAFPDRELYRYTYRGPWSPTTGATVEPRLHAIDHASGQTVRQETTLGVPEFAQRVSFRLASEGGNEYTTASASGRDSLAVALTIEDGTVALTGDAIERRTVPVEGRETLVLTALVDYGTGAGFTYRFELPVEATDGEVRALTPYTEVCRDGRLCDGEAAYVPGTHQDGVSVETNVTAP